MEIAVIAALSLAATGVFVMLAVRSGRSALAQRRELAERQFLSAKLDSDDPRFRFSGTSSTIVLDQDQFMGTAPLGARYALHRVARNEHGEYFLFISGDSPYISHLSKERAMDAVREHRSVFAREFGIQDAA
jgi:molybdopterin-guanine dinucleotide biosynthesis protein A